MESVKHNPLVTILGASGVGKSSVIFAGLLPRLQRDGGWLPISFRPLNSPFHSLAAALISQLEPSLSETDRLKESKKLADGLEKRAVELQKVVERILEKMPEDKRVVLVVDQFEEIFTLCRDKKTRERFLRRLLSVVNHKAPQFTPNLSLVIALRADFFEQSLNYRQLADALQNSSLILGPMTTPELTEVIEKPAANLGVGIEGGLTDRILKDVSREPGQLPLLEFALTLLWAKQENYTLTHMGYAEIGGVENALAGYAESVYQELDDDDRQLVQRIFVQLVRPGEGTRDTRRLATDTEIGKELWGMVSRLADKRLIVTGRDRSTGERTAEIVHEALIEGWARLREWMEADREFRVWQEQIRSAIELWNKNKRDESVLLRGALLAEALEWLEKKKKEKHSDSISKTEKEFIQLSSDLREREQAASDKRRRRITLGAVISALIFLALAGLFYMQRLQTERDRKVAQMRQIAFQAESMRGQYPELFERSILLTLEVIRQSPFLEAEQSLRRGFKLLPRLVTNVITDGAVTGVSFSPDGKYFALVSTDKTARVLEVGSGREIARLPHLGGVEKILFSPDGKYVTTSSGPKAVQVWEVNSASDVTKIIHDDKVTDVAFSPDGRLIATGSDDRTARLWDLYGGKEVKRINQDMGVRRVIFSPDGKYLATMQMMSRVAHVWDVATGREATHVMHDGMLLNIAFSPDGRYLATGSTDHSARLWEISTGKENARLIHGFTVNAMDFSRDGKFLATASEDGTARVWELDSRREVARTEHEDDVHFVSFSPNGQYVVSGCINKFGKESHYFVAKVWEAHTGREIARLPHVDGLNDISFSPDGQHVATASRDKTARIWSITENILSASIIPKGHTTRQLANLLSDDRKYRAVVMDDGSARVWELGDSSEVLRFVSDSKINISLLATESSHMALNPNGRYLAEVRLGRYEEPSQPNDVLLIWDLNNGREVNRLNITGPGSGVSQLDNVTQIKFDPAGKFLALLCGPSTGTTEEPSYIRILRVGDYREVQRFNIGSQRTVLVYSPDGKYLATGGFDNSARIWDVSNGTGVAHMQHEATKMKSIDLPDMVDCVGFSADNKFFVTGSSDTTARIWEFSTGKEIARLQHESWVRGVNFSPDGRYLATQSEEGIVRLWDVSRQQELTRFSYKDDSVSSITFSPNGRYLIKPEEGALISTWLWRTEDLVDETCKRLTRNLTKDEWTQYFGDTPYQLTCPKIPNYYPAKGKDEQTTSSAEGHINTGQEEPFLPELSGSERLDKGDYDGAILEFTEDIIRNPRDSDAFIFRGIAYSSKGDTEKALNDFKEAESLGGNLGLIYTNRSLIYKKKGDFDKALTELNAATKADPKFYGAFLERAQLYYKFGKHNQAIDDLNKAIELEPDNTKALHSRGLIYQETGAKGQAISDFVAMLERSSDAQTRADAKKHLMELGVYR